MDLRLSQAGTQGCLLRTGVLFVLALALPLASAAEPQEWSEPTEPAPQIRPGILHLNVTELSLEAEAAYERRRVGSSQPGTVTHRNRDVRFEESVNLRLVGDIVDPLLIDFDTNLKLGLTQERFQERVGSAERTESDTGLLREFDFSLNMLSGKPVSATAYGRRVRDRVPRRFLPSLLEERNEAGASAFLQLGNWTSELGFTWSDVDLSGNRAARDDEHLEVARLFADNRWEINDAQNLRIAFDHQREHSSFQGSRSDFDTNRDQLRIEHDLVFGPEKKHRLDTFVRLNNEQGDLARDEFELAPRLTLRHSDSLSTIYRYSFYEIDQDAVAQNRHKLDWQAVYRPDRSLSITGKLFGLQEHIQNDVETHQFGGGLDLSYRKPTDSGELFVNAAFHLDRERSLGDADGGIVRGESHVLDPTRPTFLIQPDIDQWSILAYNADRTRIYAPGLDYQILAVGRRTIAYRLLSGRITEDEMVFFDYRYRIPTNGRIDSARVDLRFEHAFRSGLIPYYALDVRRQNAHGSRGVPAFEDNTERHRFGLRYDRSQWSAFAELELFDDSVEPYDSYQLGAKANVWRQRDHTIDLRANASWFNFTGDIDRRSVGLIDVALSNRCQLNDYFSTSLSTVYRWETDTKDGETNAVDVECGLSFQRGQLEVELTIEYDLLTVVDHDEGFGAWLTIRRDLSHLLARKDERRP